MNAFCTEEECQRIGLDNIQFIYCSKPVYMKNKHLIGSLIFYVDKESEKFVKSITSLVLPEGKIYVLIDCGETYDLSSKVFWGFKATGFIDTKILVFGNWDSLPMQDGEVCEVTKTDEPYLPFNNSIVMKKSDLENSNSFYQQLIHVNKCEFAIADSYLQKSEIFAYFKEIGVSFSQNRSSIVFGKKACFAGILIQLVTGKTVSVVIDKITKEPVADRIPSDTKNIESKHLGYSISIDDEFKAAQTRPKQSSERDSAVCANCLVF